MLHDAEIDAAAEALLEAERSGVQIDPFTMHHDGMDIEDAYAVQHAWARRKLAAGRRIIGYKIGLTSRAMQTAMHIDEPDYGVLLDDMLLPNEATVEAARYCDPRIEVELAFVLRQRLSGTDLGVDDVLEATDYVVPALELIAARSYRVHPRTGYTRRVQDTIADNAAGAGLVLGSERIRPADTDLRWIGALCYLNGVVEETGIAAGVLDHPANGICWVARRFAPHGVVLEPGQVILSGSFTRPVIARAGDTIRADFGRHGSVGLTFR